jgi:hypothetical protein
MPPQQLDDLAGTRVPVEFRLLEYRRPVGDDLEAPAAGRDQLDFGVRKLFTKLGGQPGRPRFVVSHRAIFDRDVHA